MHISLYFRATNVYRQFPIDVIEDFCDFITYRDSHKTPVLVESGLFNTLNKTSNIIRCSFAPGQYYVRNFLLFEKNISNAWALPLGDYRLDLTVLNEKTEAVVNIKVYYQIYSKAIVPR